LSDAQPGDLIVLAPGNYSGQFLADGVSGTADDWIVSSFLVLSPPSSPTLSSPYGFDHAKVLCGTQESVLSNNDFTSGSGIEVHNATYWYLSGFTVSVLLFIIKPKRKYKKRT
jgi:hypothetical protein